MHRPHPQLQSPGNFAPVHTCLLALPTFPLKQASEDGLCVASPSERARRYLPSVLKQPCRLSGSTVNSRTQNTSEGRFLPQAQTRDKGTKKEARSFQMTPQGCELPANHQERGAFKGPDLLPRHADRQPRIAVTCSFSVQALGHPGLPEGQAESDRLALPLPSKSFTRLFSIPSGNQLYFPKLPVPHDARAPLKRWSRLPLSTTSHCCSAHPCLQIQPPCSPSVLLLSLK